jgi:hypothetical protein
MTGEWDRTPRYVALAVKLGRRELALRAHRTVGGDCVSRVRG